MNIDEYFNKYNNALAIFDPTPSYPYNFHINISDLVNNSKRDNKYNLFENFYNRTYKNYMLKIFNTNEILKYNVGLVSMPNKDGIGRSLCYSKEDFYKGLISFFDSELDKYKYGDDYYSFINRLINNLNGSNEQLNNTFVEAFKVKNSVITDLVVNEFKSDYFDYAMKDYEYYKRFMSFNEYLDKLDKTSQNIEKGLLLLGDFFDTKINVSDLKNCFDSNKFYLLFAKISMDAYKNDNKLKNYGYLFNYENYLLNNSDNTNVIITIDEKKYLYSTSDFINEFNYLKNTSKMYNIEIASNDIKYKDIYLMEKLYLLSIKNESWQIFIDKKIKNVSDIRFNILNNDLCVAVFIKDNLYAFLYPNHKIIIEDFSNNKFRETYILLIDYFIDFIESNIDLKSYMNSLDSNVMRRLFFSDINSWQRNIYKEINGSYTSKNVSKYISRIDYGDEYE